MSEVGVRESLQLQTRFAALTASDPTPAFAVKSLLHPLLAIGSLIAALSIWGQRFDGPYLMLAVFAFVAAADLLKVADRGGAVAHWHPAPALLHLGLRWGLFVAFLGVLLHVSELDHLVQTRVLVTWAFVTPLALWFGEQTVHRLLTHATSQAGPTRKAVILGLTELGLRLKRQLEHDPLLHIKVLGFFDERSPDRLPADGLSALLGSADELKDYVRREDIKLVYITLPVAPRPKVLELIDALQDSIASIYFVPDMFTCDLIQARLDVIGGIPIVAVRESPFYGAGAIAKRMTDVFLAVPLLLLAAPLLLAVAAGVRLSSPGPVLFKQRRYGLDGREIVVYKFRSLSVTEDGRSEYTQVTRGDVRLTRFPPSFAAPRWMNCRSCSMYWKAHSVWSGRAPTRLL